MISGSFWSAFSARLGSSMSSGLDDLLERDNVTLEELLDHEDVIQECKYMNSQLIDHLTRRENLEKMIKYIVTVPEMEKKKGNQTETETTKQNDPAAPAAAAAEGEGDSDSKDSDSDSDSDGDDATVQEREKKYPYVASELFACEVLTMLDALFESPELLDKLFGFLDYPAPMDPAYASYFRKVLVVLIQRKYDPLVKYIQSHGIIDKLVNHIGLYSIMELLIMIGWDDGLGQVNDVQWLYKENLIPKLVAKLAPEWEKHTDVHMNAARALVDVVVKCPPAQQNLLISHLQSTPVLQNIFSHMFSGCQSSLTNSMSIIIVLVQRYANRKVELGELGQGGDDGEMLEEPFASLMPHLPKIIELLQQAQPVMKLQFGSAEPFGENRMKVVELTLVLLRSRVPLVDKAIVELHVLKYMLDAFFAYPWNNMLHGLVESIIRTVLDSESQLLIDSLFKDGQLVDKFIAAYESGEEKNRRYRSGYMGHLLRTSAAIEEICRKSESDRAALLGDEENMKKWLDFVENKLAKENEKQKIMSPFPEDGADALDGLQFDIQAMGAGVQAFLGSAGQSGADSTGYSFKTVMMDDEDSENDGEEADGDADADGDNGGFEYDTNGGGWRAEGGEGEDWADFTASFPSETNSGSGSADYSAALESFNRPGNQRSLIQFPVASVSEEEGESDVVVQESEQEKEKQTEKKDDDFAVEFPAP